MAFRIPQFIVCAMLVAFLAVLFAAPGADATGPPAKTVAPPPFITHEFGVILFPTGEDESRPTCALQSPEFIYKPVNTDAGWSGAMADVRHQIGVAEFQNIAFGGNQAPEAPGGNPGTGVGAKPIVELPGGFKPDGPEAPVGKAPTESEAGLPERPVMETPDEPEADLPDRPVSDLPVENAAGSGPANQADPSTDEGRFTGSAVDRAERWSTGSMKMRDGSPINGDEYIARMRFVTDVKATAADANMTDEQIAKAIDDLFLKEGVRRGVLTMGEYAEMKDLSPEERRRRTDEAEFGKMQGSKERDRIHRSRLSLGLADPFLAFYPANPSDWPAEGAHVDVEISFNNGKPFYWYPYAGAGDSLNWRGLRLTTKPYGVNARTKIRQANDIVVGGEHKEHWYETARGGGSLYLSAGKTYDKFLFYGGVVAARPSLSIERKDGVFYLSNLTGRIVNDVVLISKNRNEIHYSRVASISPGVFDLPVKAAKIELSAKDFADEEASRWGLALRKAGLFKHEVDAAVNMMRKDLFESDGTRAIYLETGARAEESRKLTISPAPIKRLTVMVYAVLAD